MNYSMEKENGTRRWQRRAGRSFSWFAGHVDHTIAMLLLCRLLMPSPSPSPFAIAWLPTYSVSFSISSFTHLKNIRTEKYPKLLQMNFMKAANNSKYAIFELSLWYYNKRDKVVNKLSAISHAIKFQHL